MAFAVDGAGGEYHLLEDGSIGYWSSEGAAGRLAESMDDLFHLIVLVFVGMITVTQVSMLMATLEEYGQNKQLDIISYSPMELLGTHCESFAYAHRHETFTCFAEIL